MLLPAINHSALVGPPVGPAGRVGCRAIARSIGVPRIPGRLITWRPPRGRSSAGRALDWQSRGSWVRVPSPPPESPRSDGISQICYVSGAGCKWRCKQRRRPKTAQCGRRRPATSEDGRPRTEDSSARCEGDDVSGTTSFGTGVDSSAPAPAASSRAATDRTPASSLMALGCETSYSASSSSTPCWRLKCLSPTGERSTTPTVPTRPSTCQRVCREVAELQLA